MSPLLKTGDQLEIVPFDDRGIRQGDVLVFIPPASSSKIVHRVVSADSQGVKTKGDNSVRVDPWVLGPDHVLGRVVYVRRRDRRWRVFGGPVGQGLAAIIRAIRAIESGASSLLGPVYDRLARTGLFWRLLPIHIKARVISLNRATGTELQLLIGRRVIGKWLPGTARWHIRRPFRLFVNQMSLPRNPSLKTPRAASPVTDD